MLRTPSGIEARDRTCASAAKLRPNSAAPTSSVTVTAIWPATITCSVRPLAPPRASTAPSRRSCASECLRIDRSGDRPITTVINMPSADDERERAPIDAGRRETRQLHRAEREQRVAGPHRQQRTRRAAQQHDPRALRQASSAPAGARRRRSRAAARTRGGAIRCAPAAGSPRSRTQSPARTRPRRTAARSPAGSVRTLRSRAAILRRRASRWCPDRPARAACATLVTSACACCERHARRQPRQRREAAVAASGARLRRRRRDHRDPHFAGIGAARERRRRDADDREDLVVELNRLADHIGVACRTRAPTSARRSPPRAAHSPASSADVNARPSNGSTPSAAK